MVMREHRRPGHRFGLTLVDLLASIGIVGLLTSLLLPSVQTAREAARSLTCKNRLKQLSLGLVSYEAAHQVLPPGARIGPYRTMGVSWLVEVLPFIEEETLYDRYNTSSLHSGGLLLHRSNRAAVDGVRLPAFLCPSSPLAPLYPIGLTGSQVMMPSFVGIAGATSHNGFIETRVSPCCVPALNGEISAGGALPPNKGVRLREVTAGLSKTLCLAESSDYAYSESGQAHRVDGGFPNGWVAGALSPGVPPLYQASYGAWNITSVRYGLNLRDYDLPGVYENRGANNPLLSAHPGVVNVAMLDGRVLALADSLPLLELTRMATRNDDSSAADAR